MFDDLNRVLIIDQSIDAVTRGVFYFEFIFELELTKTLIFDLDETLIHCNENADVPSDVTIDITFPTGE